MEQENNYYSFMNAPSATDRLKMLERRKMQKAARLTLETLEKAGVSFHVVQVGDDDPLGNRQDMVLVARMEGNDIATFPYFDDEYIGE